MEILEGEKSLSFYCKTSPSFKKKFGVFSLYKAHFTWWLEKILLSLEYIQLLSLTILIHPTVYQVSDSNSKNPILFEIIVDFLKLANPSYLLSFTHSDKTTISVLCIILGFALFKYMMLFYAISLAFLNKEPNNILKTLWRWLFKLQGRIACCFMTSFWIRTIVSVSNDSFSIQGISSSALVTISVVLMILEYLFSFLLEMQFCDFTPTRGYLSAKNYDMQIITLLQKFVLQIIQLFAYNNFSASIWVCIVLNLMFSIFREYRFFSTLPLYDYYALQFQGSLTSIVLSLNVVHCIQQALADSTDYSQESDIKLLIILWTFAGIMSWKLSNSLIIQTYVKLLTGKDQRKTPEILLHKIFATKYLVENRMIPTTDSVKSDMKHLLGVVQSLNMYEVFGVQPLENQENNSYDIHDKEERTRIFLKYLEDLTHLFPKNQLIKLNLAYCIYKSTRFQSKIIKIISQKNENIWSPYHMSSALLLHDLQITTNSSDEQENISTSLNIKQYLECQLLMEDLQNEILKQTELSKQICNNIVQDTATIETIYENAQIIHKVKETIQDKMTYLTNHIPDSFFYPYQVYAEYSLFLNYSIKDYYKYCEIYSRKSLKVSKELELNNLCEENIYHENNSFLILSADRHENICIVYSTKSIQKMCGLDRTKQQNIPISKIFPPGLRSYYDEMFKEIFEKGHSSLTNRIIHTYLYHQEGYLVEADIFTRIHPYVGRQLYVDMILRPHYPSGEDIILVNENGRIEGVSKSLTQYLKIENTSSSMQTTNTIHIKQISEDLAHLNNAFNIIQEKNEWIERGDTPTPKSPQKKNSLFSFSSVKFKLHRYATETPRLDYIRATELYNSYISGKKPIELQNIPFKSKISRLNFQQLNLIKLEKASRPISLEKLDSSPRSLHLLPKYSEENLEERIDVENIPSHRYRTMTTREIISPEYISTIKDADENLVSPTTSSRLFLNTGFSPTRRKLRSPERAVSFNFDNLISSPSLPKAEAKQIPIDTPKSNVSESTHESSKISQISAVFKTFERAITSRSHQKSFNFLCVIFYGVILTTLVSEIIIKSVLDSTMNNLIIKTDLLNFAQLRTYQTCRMHNIARGSILQIAGIVTDTDLNVPNRQLKGNLATMLSALKVLLQANDGIQNNINNENDEIKQMLFEKDINITGNAVDPTDPKYQLVTSFQQVDIVTNALMVLKSLTTLISAAASRTFAFLANNLPNDFLAKNEEIIKVFRASVKQQKENLQTTINLSVIVLPLLLAGIVTLLIVIIWRQYNKEKKYFLAFLKLDPSKVQHILENLKIFQKKLLNQEKFEDDLVPKLIYKLEHSAQSYHKAHDSKAIKYGKMQRRYFLYIFQILFYISILIIIVIVNYALITKSTKEIYRKQEQIQYANDISMTVSVTFIAEMDTFVTNNTNYIMRQRPFDLFKTGIQDVAQIQTNLYKEFQDEHGDYDPEVKTILFEEISCDHFIAGPYTFCNSLKSLGQTMKMVSILTLYKNMLDNKYAQYLTVDKSSLANLIAAATTQVSYLQASSAVTSAYAQLIAQAISKKLASSVDDIYDLGAAILIVFSLSLVIVSLLIWFQILKKVKEVNNDFKKVLAVLPANIILSSFLLKTFLNRTSNIVQKL